MRITVPLLVACLGLIALATSACDSGTSQAEPRIVLTRPFREVVFEYGADSAVVSLAGHFRHRSELPLTYIATASSGAHATVRGTDMILHFANVDAATVELTASASDGASLKATLTASRGSVLVMTPLTDTTITFETGPVTIPFVSLLRHSKGFTTTYTVQQTSGTSVDVSITGDQSLTLTPRTQGTTVLSITGFTSSDGARLTRTYRVHVVVPDRIETTPAAISPTTRVTKIALRPTYARHLDGGLLTFHIDESAPAWLGASIVNSDTLLLRLEKSGEAVLTIFAYDRGRKEQLDLIVRASAVAEFKCDFVPTGSFDPFPFQNGNKISYQFNYNTTYWSAYTEKRSFRSGVLEWKAVSSSCSDGVITLSLSERFSGLVSDSTVQKSYNNGELISRVSTGHTSHLDTTYSVRSTFRKYDSFPVIGQWIGRDISESRNAIGYFVPYAGAQVGLWAGSTSGRTTVVSSSSGLVSWVSVHSSSSHGNPNTSKSLTIKRL